MTNIKTLFQTHKTTIYTHLTAFIVGGIISFLIFTTQTETQENETELIEINAGTEILKEDFKPTEDFKEEYEMVKAELKEAYKETDKVRQQLKKEQNEKIINAQYLSDEQLFRFVSEWAKRNGSLPQ